MSDNEKPKVNYFNIAAVLTVVAGLGAIAGSAFMQKNSQPPAVRVANAAIEDITETVIAEGRTVPYQQIRVVAQVSGVVESVLVDVGDWVEMGQTLLKIDPRDLMDLYQQAKLDLASAQQKLKDSKTFYERYQDLFEKKIAPAHLLDEARRIYTDALYGLDSAQLNYDLQERRLEKLTIEAPVSGVISGRFIQPGEITKGVVFAIDTPELRFMALVDERTVEKLKLDLPAEVTLTAYPGRIFKGAIKKISPSMAVEGRNQGFPVWIDIPHEGLSGSGLTGYAKIRIQRSCVVIPVAALTYFSGERGLVFAVKNSASHLAPVVVGASHNGKVEILQGVQAGDQVVIEGQEDLRDQGAVTLEK